MQAATDISIIPSDVEQDSCPNKDVCGSCTLSDVPYADQLAQKRSGLNQLLEKEKLPYRCDEILPSPKQSHYRNRMDFVIDFEGRVGLRQKGKWWRVIDNHHCFISDRSIEVAFQAVRDWVRQAGISYFDRKKHHGLLRFAVVRVTLKGETLVDIVTSVPKDIEEREFLRSALTHLSKSEHITTLVWSTNSTIADVSFGDIQEVFTGTGTLIERIRDTDYRISPHAFFQTNSHAAPLLLDTVQEWAQAAGGKRLLDLYCGTGFFALALARSFNDVVGVELSEEAILDARHNAALNGVTVDFHVAASESFSWGSLGADTVIIDPPRGGIHKSLLTQIGEHRPKTLLYVSCNYKNCVTDLGKLQELYEPRSMRMIDLFPHTPHVELVTWLELRG
jgi:tRNA (uracil-5-)-methyltransferase